MPFELKVQRPTELRCTNCGRLIREGAIVVKTCCVNKPCSALGSVTNSLWLSGLVIKTRELAAG